MKPMIDDPKTKDERGWVVLRQPVGSGNRAARRAAAATGCGNREKAGKETKPPMSKGFVDKLYWRRVHVHGPAHCFRKQDGKYRSLCGSWQIARTGGQGCKRPPPVRRCSQCDGAEMIRRGWDESGPDSAA